MTIDKRSVLVVDDEEVIRDFLWEVLEDDYQVTTATDGDEAIEEIKKHTFDIIITDLKMPRVSGEEVVKYARENSPDSRIIVISGYSSLYSVSQSVSGGASTFLSKPFTIKQLLGAIAGSSDNVIDQKGDQI